MVETPRVSAIARHDRSTRVAREPAIALVVICAMAASLMAQGPEVHYRHQGSAPPGAIGRWQLERGGPLLGYFQPVEIRAPDGARISLAVEGRFIEPLPAPLEVGLLVAPVYRLQVSGIPNQPGAEVFPTIEIIDRLYPQTGSTWRFPISIEIAQEDLELALAGKFVMRVIYLEDPELALPSEDPPHQNWYDVGPGKNPLHEADRLGRPVALLRMGGRLPPPTGPDMQFLFNCPPVLFRGQAVPPFAPGWPPTGIPGSTDEPGLRNCPPDFMPIAQEGSVAPAAELAAQPQVAPAAAELQTSGATTLRLVVGHEDQATVAAQRSAETARPTQPRPALQRILSRSRDSR